MDDKLFAIFSKNLRRYLDMNGKTQADLCKYMGVSSAAVSDWCNGNKMPRVDKIQSICNWLHVGLDDMLTERDVQKNAPDSWYYDSDTRQIADRIKNDSRMRVLFDAARDARPEDLEKAASFIQFLKGQQNERLEE